jgi:DNA-3-methyladenine glycosylase
LSGRLPIRRLSRRGLPADTIALARCLVGKILVRETARGRLSGRIVETEAYPVGDSTSYAYRGRTKRNAPLFLERGHAYVRLVYGAWYSLNVSGERQGVGAAVLIRALEPLEGVHLMQRRRRGATHRDLARGPGRLAAAFGIDPRFDAIDLVTDKRLWIGRVPRARPRIGVTTRIGLSRERHRPLRFYEIGSAFVSGPRKLISAPRPARKSRSPARRSG